MNWKPIEEFDSDSMHRIPVFVHAPDWYDGIWPKANIAMGYWDKWEDGGRWHITMFESASAYAWVTYNSRDFEAKLKFFAEIPDFTLP